MHGKAPPDKISHNYQLATAPTPKPQVSNAKDVPYSKKYRYGNTAFVPKTHIDNDDVASDQEEASSPEDFTKPSPRTNNNAMDAAPKTTVRIKDVYSRVGFSSIHW